jgi:molybdopterin-guanine dinucleotide biosynthesis protein A
MMPPLNGLILVGGRSRRMQEDKGLINLHGKPQRIYTYDLLNQSGISEVYFSCRPDQMEALHEYKLIVDPPAVKGPPDVILNAFQQAPGRAWLVVACDLPLLTSDTIRELIAHRNPQKMATAFQLPERGFPEPLITIWEPKAKDLLETFFAQGGRRLIDFLQSDAVEIVEPNNPMTLYNMNDPVARKYVEGVLGERRT